MGTPYKLTPRQCFGSIFIESGSDLKLNPDPDPSRFWNEYNFFFIINRQKKSIER